MTSLKSLLTQLIVKHQSFNPKTIGYSRVLFFGLLFLTTTSDYITHFSNLPTQLECHFSMGAWYTLELNFEQSLWLLRIYKASLLLSMIGLFSVFSFWTSFLSFFILNLNSAKFCVFNHNYYPLIIALFFWALLDNASDFRVDQLIWKNKKKSEPLPLMFFLRAHFCLIFFFSGLSKLRHSGLDWILSENLHHMAVMQRFYFESFPQAQTFEGFNRLFISQSWLAQPLAFLTIFAELSAPLTLFIRKTSWFIVRLLLLLQLGILAFMYINFASWLPLYICWINWSSPSKKPFSR